MQNCITTAGWKYTCVCTGVYIHVYVYKHTHQDWIKLRLALSMAAHLLSMRSWKQLHISCQHRPPAFQDQAMQRSKNSPEFSTTLSVRAKLPSSWKQMAVRAGIAVFMSSLLVASTPDPRQSHEQLLIVWVILAPPPPCHQLSPFFTLPTLLPLSYHQR